MTEKAPDYIVLAIPVFFALIALEILVSWRRKLGLYRLSDAVGSMSTGVMEQVLTAATFGAAFIGPYHWLHENARLLDWDRSAPWVWVAGFVGADFCYYWWHRVSHVVNFLWAGHVVHHQSEEYNLTTALRQSWFAGLSSIVFYLPLAVLGVPAVVFLTGKAFMILYQFWIHTRLIPKLGPLELVFNTPSHHRVHHGINPEYLDKNFAGTFIVWDRLFGTFEEERAPVAYGVLKPLRSWNPLAANLHTWMHIWEVGAQGALVDRVRAVFAHPAWAPGRALPTERELRAQYRKVSADLYDVRLGRGAKLYLAAQFALLLGAASVFLNAGAEWPRGAFWAAASWLLFSLVSLGWFSERRQFAPATEALRLSALLATPLFL